MTKRITILNIVLYVSFFIIGIRLFSLQMINHEEYVEKLKKLNEKVVYGDLLPRGKIYDSKGQVLVENKLVPVIYYKNDNKLSTKKLIELAYEMKDHLELDFTKLTTSILKDFYLLEHEKEIQKKIPEKEYTSYKRHEISDRDYYKLKKSFVTEEDINRYTEEDRKAIYLYYLMTNGYSYEDKIIKKDASEEEFAYFSESNSHLNGFNTKYIYDRDYVNGTTLKTILGSVGTITKENKEYYLKKGYELDDMVGLSGLEYVYDDYLKGEKETYKLDGKELILLEEGKMGKDLYTTIDITLQKMVDNALETELKNAKRGLNTRFLDRSYVTISNPMNGDILAISGKLYQNGIMQDYNLGAVLDTMVSGSVVKGASILVGYNEGKVKIGEGMVDECIKIKSTPKKCSIYTMGYVTDLDALKKSSNVYQFKIALRVAGVRYGYDMPAPINTDAFSIYRDYFSLFGLGVSTGIDLERENTGIKGQDENAGLLMNLAIGQYDSYTNIELNQYISTLANGKVRYPLHFLKEIKQGETIVKTYEPSALNTLEKIEEVYINRVKQGFKLVITEGTGRGYIEESKNASGKTGTSETLADSDGDGKYETKTISTAFVAYLPSDNPKYAISITTPNISYVNSSSDYVYPFNKLVIRKITDQLSI